MKRFLIVATFLAFASGAALAQHYDFGLRAGVNANQLVTKKDDLQNDGFRYGFVGGAFLRLGIGDWYVQPELLLSQKGANMKSTNDNNDVSEVRRSINSMDVPVLLGRRFAGGLVRANLGPVFSFPVSVKEDLTINGQPQSGEYEAKTTVGYQVGIGVDISKITIDLRYEGGLSRLGKDSYTIGNTQFEADDRVSLFQLTVGFKIIGN